MMNFDLTGKVAIVTGAGRGLGIELSTTLAEYGASVALISRSKDVLEASAKEITEQTGSKVMAFPCDLRNENMINETVDAIMKEFGRIDILVNNAGYITYGETQDISLEEWNKCIETDLTGPFLMMKAVGKAWMLENGGHIINISSVSALRASRESSVYHAAKAGVIGLTESTAAAWAKYGVFVNCICPGCMSNGEMSKGMTPELDASVSANIPMGHRGNYGDLSGALIYLASDACSYTTGATIVVDGGLILESF